MSRLVEKIHDEVVSGGTVGRSLGTNRFWHILTFLNWTKPCGHGTRPGLLEDYVPGWLSFLSQGSPRTWTRALVQVPI